MSAVTDIFYDSTRRKWVVEYDERPDRQAHFPDRSRAFAHAAANGWAPPPGWVSGAGLYEPADIDDTE